jgi:AcrR family transcriptional regulator
MTRKYKLQRRAERQEETRRRIVQAAVELHTTVGPAHTTDVAIAERARVTRRTFYRHFADEVALFRACSSHGLKQWPPPNPDRWREMVDPEERLWIALRQLYDYYREAGAGLMVTARDAPLLRPELYVSPSRVEILKAIPGILLQGWRVRGRNREVLAAALHHVTAVTTWHSLVVQQSLTETEAVNLLTAMVRSAAVGKLGSVAGTPTGGQRGKLEPHS